MAYSWLIMCAGDYRRGRLWPDIFRMPASTVPSRVRRKLVGHKGPLHCIRFNGEYVVHKNLLGLITTNDNLTAYVCDVVSPSPSPQRKAPIA